MPDDGAGADAGLGEGADAGTDGGVSTTPDAPPNALPQFDLTVMTPNRPVLVGATEPLSVSITRMASFTGPVVVTASGLPAGVTASSITILPGETSGSLMITVDASASHSSPKEISVTAIAGSTFKTATATLTVHGLPGTLDDSFGTRLVSIGSGDDYADAMAVQPDGKILLAGTTVDGTTANFALVRLDRDGARDPGFGTDGDGTVVTDIASSYDIARAIAIQPDGKIVVAGSAATGTGTGTDFAIVRYMPDGTLDHSFSGDGKVTTALGTDTDAAYAVAIQPDGKIVVAGSSQRGFATTGVDVAIARYNADGSLDASFGPNGIGFVTTPIAASNNSDVAYAIALPQLAGETRILVAGGDSNFQLARYRPNGDLDTTFGTGGKVATIFTGYTGGAARALALAPDNSIFLAGYVAESWNHTLAVAHLTSSGTLDTQFGPSAVAFSGSFYNEATAIVLDGTTPIVAGFVHQSALSTTDFALVRFQSNGEVDPSFNGGRILTPVAPMNQSDSATAMALQVDTRIPGVRLLAAGRAQDTNLDFAIARYWGRVTQP